MNKSLKKIAGLQETQKKGDEMTKKPRSNGKTAKQIVTRHILDKNDVITEEEFKNLNIGIDVFDDTAPPPLEISNDTERPKDEDKDPAIIIPWDLINE